ncbi:MAG: hypothetical protein ACYCOU_14995 [Sulfobacillus sp.]
MEWEKTSSPASASEPTPQHAHATLAKSLELSEAQRSAIVDNVSALFAVLARLKHPLHLRAPLLSQLLRHLPVGTAAEIGHVSSSAVFSARRDFVGDDVGDLAMPYPPGVHHRRVSPVELHSIRALIADECKGEWQKLSNDELYKRYCQRYASSLDELVSKLRAAPADHALDPALQTLLNKFDEHSEQLAFLSFARSVSPSSAASAALAGGHVPGPINEVLSLLHHPTTAAPAPRSRPFFDLVRAAMHLKRTYKDWGAFDCVHCATGHAATASLERLSKLKLPLSPQLASELASAQADVRKFQQHQLVVHSQCAAVSALDHNRSASHVVIFWDYAQIDPQQNVSAREKFLIEDLIMVIERPDGWRVYIDFLVADRASQSPGIFFDRAALLFLFEQTAFLSPYDEVTFVSDCCAPEFRSCHVFALMAWLQQRVGKLLHLLYKAERHGKGICDAHKGHIARLMARKMKSQSQFRSDQPASAAQQLSPFTDAESVALFLSNSFHFDPIHKREFHTFLLDKIDHDPAAKPDVRRVPGTMGFHEVSFLSADTLRVKPLSTDEHDDIVHLRFNTPYCPPGLPLLILCC